MIGTGLTAAAIAYLSKDGVNKLIGPSLDYIGNELKTWVEYRHKNTEKILDNAEQKAANKLHQKGSIPLKVLKEVLDEGSLRDDGVSIEYLGGVLASSRTKVGRDDRGAKFAALINSCSSYELRAHCILYMILEKKQETTKLEMGTDNGRRQAMTVISQADFIKAMKFSEDELSVLSGIFSSMFHGLYAAGLIGQWGYGDKSGIEKLGFKTEFDTTQILFTPTGLGIQLYLWAFGSGDASLEDFGDLSLYKKNSDSVIASAKPLS